MSIYVTPSNQQTYFYNTNRAEIAQHRQSNLDYLNSAAIVGMMTFVIPGVPQLFSTAILASTLKSYTYNLVAAEPQNLYLVNIIAPTVVLSISAIYGINLQAHDTANLFSAIMALIVSWKFMQQSFINNDVVFDAAIEHITTPGDTSFCITASGELCTIPVVTA